VAGDTIVSGAVLHSQAGGDLLQVNQQYSISSGGSYGSSGSAGAGAAGAQAADRFSSSAGGGGGGGALVPAGSSAASVVNKAAIIAFKKVEVLVGTLDLNTDQVGSTWF
jgi:type II secretory pathway component GspD/PulD (secretin)